jgi:medium-chain acyl-[acyl-carrier-protein] hydrolase
MSQMPLRMDELSGQTCGWVSCPRPDPGARLRLFCLPPAGGGALLFRSWPGRLPGVEVCLVHLPGRDARRQERPSTHWEPLVQALAAGLEPWLERPFAFFGHSMGALLAFELARRLRRAGRRMPEALVASGKNAPSRPWNLPRLSRLSDEALALWLRRLGGTPGEVLEDPDLRRAILPLVRADMAVCESYAYRSEAPLPCALAAFAGLQDPHTDPQGLEAWRDECARGFAVHSFAGDHFFLRSAEGEVLGVLARELAQTLEPEVPAHDLQKESSCTQTRRFTLANWTGVPSTAGGAS